MEITEQDKCTEQFTFRIPEILKRDWEKLSKVQKSENIEELKITMAQAIHRAKFHPGMYLNSNYLE